MTLALKILNGGLMTTVQDLGRFGFQQSGLSASGAMDPFAIQAANLLAGNARSDAAVEIAYSGPVLRALDDLTVAITGADLDATIDGAPAPMWQAFPLSRGRQLRFGHRRSGAWAYLAVAGGIDVPVVLGSRSTFVRGKLGGFEGRPLAKGDSLCRGEPRRVCTTPFPASAVPAYPGPADIRVVLGPQAEAFTDEAVRTFLSTSYEVTRQSDRMGYRLAGPALGQRGRPEIITDAVAFGSVQVPADGQPILLMAERQTTGGYPKIATVITADLGVAAQLIPGAKLRFRAVSLAEARSAALEQESLLRSLESPR